MTMVVMAGRNDRITKGFPCMVGFGHGVDCGFATSAFHVTAAVSRESRADGVTTRTCQYKHLVPHVELCGGSREF